MNTDLLVDSHCHLNMISDDTATILAQAKQAGVGYFLNVSVELNEYAALKQSCEQFDNVYASVGVHPNHAITTSVEELSELASADHIIAVGETGLDYFRPESEDFSEQQQRFRQHIQAAKAVKKPLIIHCRDAAADTLRILREENARDVGGIMHCFVEDWLVAQQAMDLGFYISFSGIVTFKSAKTLQAVAKQLPLNQMLVETDSPYLAPVPHRGKKNCPAFVTHVAAYIAELRDMPVAEITRATTQNFAKLHQL